VDALRRGVRDFNHGEGRSYRAFRIVLVRLGVPEVSEDTVAYILRHASTVARDDVSASLPMSLDQLCELFRVQAQRKAGVTHQIAKHYGELTPLGWVDGTHEIDGLKPFLFDTRQIHQVANQ
jgi:hypothetical protein